MSKTPKYQKRVDQVLKAHKAWLNLQISDREFDRQMTEIYNGKSKKEERKELTS